MVLTTINHGLSFREARQRVRPILSWSTVAFIVRFVQNENSHNVTVYHCVFQLSNVTLLAEQTVSTVMQLFHQSHLCDCHDVSFDMLSTYNHTLVAEEGYLVLNRRLPL